MNHLNKVSARVKAIVFLILGFFFVFASSVVTATNLLQNPGFEEGVNNWNLSPSTATFSTTPSVKHSGNYGAIITKENASSWAYLSQKVAIEAEEYYQFSGWVLLNDDTIKNVKLRFYWLDASETKISSTPVEIELREKNSSFQFLQTEPILSPQNAQFVDTQGYVYLDQKNPPTPAVFDDLVFERVLPPSPSPSPSPSPEESPSPSPESSPSPQPEETSSPSETPNPKAVEVIGATFLGKILGEEVSPAGFFPWEATEGAESQEATVSPRAKFIPKLFLGSGLVFLVVSGVYLWYTQHKQLK